MKKILLLTMLLSIGPFSSSAALAAAVLVDTGWLASNINNKNIVLIDTSDHTQHLRFHIPGSIHIDYSEIVYKRKTDKVSIQVPNDYFVKLLAQRGISNDKHIVIYDDMGGLNAGRLFWQLEQIGHKEVSVLNGGLVKWIIEGRKVSNQSVQRPPAQYQANASGQKNNLATIADVQNRQDSLLIDARTKDEYIGHPKYPRTGHVPAAKNWDWQNNVDFENAFVIKNSQQITAQQKHISLNNKQQNIITYCQSGHRAAQSYLTLRSMGFENIKLYDGSMAEYSQNKQAALEKGCSSC
ncbi:MAG: rhodanese-like domain-containing protein [Gammaproteobacteria bacterium]|nr:rhodanese-like domain-containing protein [Gammaproteobacteria bacterium]